MDINQATALLEIMDLTARYTRAGDTGRAGDLAALFAPDGTLELSGGSGAGYREIVELIEVVKDEFASASEGFFPARHTVSGLVVDFVDDEHASGRSYFVLVCGRGIDHWGTYRDDYVKVDGRWRFARRRGLLDGAMPDSPVGHRLGVKP